MNDLLNLHCYNYFFGPVDEEALLCMASAFCFASFAQSNATKQGLVAVVAALRIFSENSPFETVVCLFLVSWESAYFALGNLTCKDFANE